MKSAVIASMFTGTSLSACFVRVAESVSLADQPVSRSDAITNGESLTASSFVEEAPDGTGATCAGVACIKTRNNPEALIKLKQFGENVMGYGGVTIHQKPCTALQQSSHY